MHLLKTELLFDGYGNVITLCEHDNTKITKPIAEAVFKFTSSYTKPLIDNSLRFCKNCVEREVRKEETKKKQLEQRKALQEQKLKIEKELSLLEVD